MGFKARHNLQSMRGWWYELKPAMLLPKKNVLLHVDETAHRTYDRPLLDWCYWPPLTYFLIFADGENIQYQRGSSFGISTLLGNTSHFIPIQWHSDLSILDTEYQIHFNILPRYRPRKGDVRLLRSVQGNQIEIHTPGREAKTFKVSNSSILIWTKDVAVSALQPLKYLTLFHMRSFA